MKTFVNNSGYNIKMNTLNKDQFKKIKNDLTVIPYNNTTFQNQKKKYKIYKYHKNKKYIIVPKFFGIKNFGKPNKNYYNPEKIKIKFLKKLKNNQEEVSLKCINHIKKYNGGVLSVPCGFGKTVCALYISHILGYKTLVIVHKTFLLNQWIERILEFLNIKINRIGIIKQKRCEYENKDFVIGMIHTISKKKMNVFKHFGFVIYDESHHIVSKFFTKALFKTSLKYSLALTATPYRCDGLINLMYLFTGNIIYIEKNEENKNVIVKMIHYSTGDTLFQLKKRWILGKLRPDTGKMVTNICNIKTRNNSIIKIIKYFYRNESKRKILILSERRKHLELIKKKINIKIKNDIKNNIINKKNEINICDYVGDTKLKERRYAETNGDIILATYQMAQEGLDIKHLNTVILASPKKNITQSIGRIMRKTLKTGDIKPLIIDISDDIDIIKLWVSKRLDLYLNRKYIINHYFLYDDFIYKSDLIGYKESKKIYKKKISKMKDNNNFLKIRNDYESLYLKEFFFVKTLDDNDFLENDISIPKYLNNKDNSIPQNYLF